MKTFLKTFADNTYLQWKSNKFCFSKGKTGTHHGFRKLNKLGSKTSILVHKKSPSNTIHYYHVLFFLSCAL